MQFVRACGQGLVSTGLDVEIREGDRRNLKVARIARDRHVLDALRTGHTRGSGLDVVLHLGIIHIEIVREIHLRVLHQLHIAITGNLQLDRHRLIGLHPVGTDLRIHAEGTYRTGEGGWLARRQRFHVDRHRGRGQCLAHIPVGVEEAIKDTPTPLWLHTDTHHRIILSAPDRDLARTLRIENHLTHHR